MRPLNRPERRLAALAQIVAVMPKLMSALRAKEDKRFAKLLLEIRDEFWEKRATLTGTELSAPCRLLGEERVQDILINVFWPLVSLDDAAAAERGLIAMTSAPNNASRLATQRMLLASAHGPAAARGPGAARAAANLSRLLPDRLLTVPKLHLPRTGQLVELAALIASATVSLPS